jgi:putative membrane protein
MAWHTGDGMGWWMLFGGFLWIAFWGAAIYAVAFLMRGHRIHTDPRTDEAIEILKRRYASGEISKDEYEQIRDDVAA